MIRYVIIVFLSVVIVMLTPYAYRDMRRQIADNVSQWPEMQVEYTRKQQEDMNKFVAIQLPKIDGIN